jgi:formylmethanofuran dehydrogenase subunit E
LIGLEIADLIDGIIQVNGFSNGPGNLYFFKYGRNAALLYGKTEEQYIQEEIFHGF